MARSSMDPSLSIVGDSEEFVVEDELDGEEIV